jgi:hypothetical protein
MPISLPSGLEEVRLGEPPGDEDCGPFVALVHLKSPRHGIREGSTSLTANAL